MIELLLAESFFTARLARRRHFLLRAAGGWAICLAFSFAFPLVPGISQTAWYSSVMFLSMFAVTLLTIHLSYEGAFKSVLFCAIAGYTMQHIAQESYEILNIALGLNGKLASDFYGDAAISWNGLSWFVILLYACIFIIVYTVLNELFAARAEEEIGIKSFYMTIVSLVIVLVDVVISSSVTYLVPSGANSLLAAIAHLYNIICCLLVLFLLFELPKRMNAEKELDVVRRIHHREKQQYFMMKENIDLINMKCHDMKHQLRLLTEAGARGEFIEEMENVIAVYDSTVKTDNDVLDVILTEKSLLCRKLSIQLSCIVDGARLDFMKDTDIYSLFGNILSNAIEAVEKLPPEQRMISISVRSYNSVFVINVSNNYEGDINFDDNLPATNKSDKDFHGFGMKSIRYIVDKYNGEMKITTEKHTFNIKIVFPLE